MHVLASGLHPRVRSSADGSHYTSDGELPLIPGIDGVGRLENGELRYFVLPDTRQGAMAEQTLIDPRRSVVLPEGSDVHALAAGMNPGMSSWVALRRRVAFAPGSSVLVLGATGNAGRMALQVARHLGAGTVIAAGRDAKRLAALDADSTVGFDELERAADADVVLDYVWGRPAAAAIRAIVTARRDRGRALDWVQIGSVAGPDLALPSAALRAANLRVLGSGQGSVSTAAIVEELPGLAAAITSGVLDVEAETRPLEDVEAVWDEAVARRVVFVP
ncbi:NADPH:quinone reductase-like Zn-dependent oxidoreductase [Solirubrobacter pauli]|uniref:NADPH:quinone reductase-like Zn-dependent oxidoreductase n=1 Tax=Solirubrobacter pauli TaxID=166793 RepID=A0A660LCT9_9ACTN|nr:zinc-binding alcohol dehydrogenase family protein [Solirubrobacter pauli]RKQ92822.1 NADPH:quinone reductase-like Zn-dependent oxidoreductase [Solirubrobacter pauli]